MTRNSFTGMLVFYIGFLLSSLMGEQAVAKPVGMDDAKRVAENWVAHHPKQFGGKTVKQVDLCLDAEGNTIAYSVQLSPTGLVILSADDSVNPVVAFSADCSAFDSDEENPLGALSTRDMNNRSREARETKAMSAEREKRFGVAQNRWQRLLANDATSTVPLSVLSDTRVDPLVKSQWNQGAEMTTSYGYISVYNYYTPPGLEGDWRNYPCGCMNTAIAQLLRYHQYPKQGVGTQSFQIAVDSVLTTASLRGGDGLGGPYNWDQMTLVPIDFPPYLTDIKTASCQAISALTYDVAVSQRSWFAHSGTSAGADSHRAIMNVFKYSQEHCGSSVQYDTMPAGIINMLNPELDAGYPIIVGVGSKTSLHGVVCDGYGYDDGIMYHHLNMGWAGCYDFWYNLPEVEEAGFNLIDYCLYNIFPTGTGEIISGRVLDKTGNPRPGVLVTAKATDGRVWTAITNDRGIYAIAKIPALTEYQVSITSPTLDVQVVTTGESVDFKEYSGNVWGVDFPKNPKPVPPPPAMLVIY